MCASRVGNILVVVFGRSLPYHNLSNVDKLHETCLISQSNHFDPEGGETLMHPLLVHLSHRL